MRAAADSISLPAIKTTFVQPRELFEPVESELSENSR